MTVYKENVNILQVLPFYHLGITNRGYYMAARRYEFSLRVLKNISRVSAANE